MPINIRGRETATIVRISSSKKTFKSEKKRIPKIEPIVPGAGNFLPRGPSVAS